MISFHELDISILVLIRSFNYSTNVPYTVCDTSKQHIFQVVKFDVAAHMTELK